MKFNLVISSAECQKRSERAIKQAKLESSQGENHIQIVLACSREWHRRMEWADRHGGVFNLSDYNDELDAQYSKLGPRQLDEIADDQ